MPRRDKATEPVDAPTEDVATEEPATEPVDAPTEDVATEEPATEPVDAPTEDEAEGDEEPSEVVLVPFAYASAKDGQVVQLLRGDSIDADRYRNESLEHLRSIGFIGSDKS